MGRGGGLGSRRLRDSGLPDGSALWGIRGFAVTSGHFVSFRRLCLSGGRFILLGRAALAWLCFLLASGPRFFFFGRAATPGRFRHKKMPAKCGLEAIKAQKIENAFHVLYSLILIAPSMAPSIIGKYGSGHSFNLWPTLWRCSLPSGSASGWK